jgi:hypothetical protein
LTVTANATGGTALAVGTPGSATSVAQAVGAQTVNAIANSTSPGAGADASASAQSSAGPASADAIASGVAARSSATAQSAFRFVMSGQSVANLPAGVRGLARARVAVGQGVVQLGELAANQNAAVTTASPRNVDALLTLADNPNVRGTLNIGGEGSGPRSDILAIATLGGGQSATATASSQTFSASTSFSVDPSKLSSAQDLMLGLLHPQVANAGFDTLRFRVLAGAATLVDQTFDSVAAASAYFDDHLIDLGNNWTDGGTGTDSVVFTVLSDVTASRADQRFFASLVLANATHGAGGLPADADHDGRVGFADFQRLELSFGSPGDFSQGDFDGSGMVDVDDFRVFYRYVGQTADPLSAAQMDQVNAFASANGVAEVPEPGAIAPLLAGCVVGVLGRRRRRESAVNVPART